MPSPQRRRGTFVTGQLGARRRLRVQTTLDDLVAMYSGDRPDHATLSVGVVAPVLSESDGQKAPKYYYLRRVHSRDGERYGVISIYIDHRVFRRAPARFRRELALPVLTALPGLKIASARQMLTISTADVETSGLLRIPVNAPGGDYIHLEMDLKP